MCNVRTEHVDIMRNDPKVRGKSLNQLFPQHFMDNLPYHKIKIGCCIQCGRRMSRHEMEPPGKTPRAICPECYAKWTSEVTKKCPICDENLPNHKVQAQSSNPQEVSFRIHDGKCLDYFSIVSCKALGDDMSFLADETGHQPQQKYDPPQQNYPQPTHPQPNIEAQKEGIKSQIKALEAQLQANIGDKDITLTKIKVLLAEYDALENQSPTQTGQQPDFVDAEYYEQTPGQLTGGWEGLPEPSPQIVPSENMPFQPERVKVKKQIPSSYKGKPVVRVPKKR